MCISHTHLHVPEELYSGREELQAIFKLGFDFHSSKKSLPQYRTLHKYSCVSK